jgi:predicted glutamine amidotransferase
MCGLVGIAGDLEYKDEATMERLFMLDYFRGKDSTGLAAIRDNNDVHLVKLDNGPIALFGMGKYKTALTGSSSKVFIGHNRFATRGAVNEVNAHPFRCGHIIGAHNGTLETRDKWDLEELAGDKFDVDSHAFFAAVAKVGIDEAMKVVTEGTTSTSGAWAFVWYDLEQGTLNFLRNKHRPLWYACSKDFKKLFWASQYKMIDAAVSLSDTGYEMYVENKTGHGFWQFEENMHYRFDIDVLKKGEVPLPKPKAKALKGREPVKAAHAGNNSPFGRQSNEGKELGFHTPRGTTTTRTTSTRSKPNNIHLIGDADNPFAGWIDKMHYGSMTRIGCHWCKKEIPWGTAGLTVYYTDEVVLCSECSGHDNDNAHPATRIYLTGDLLDAMM